MKEIRAIIRPNKLMQVISELNKIEGLPGITITETKGFGKTKGFAPGTKEESGLFEFVPKVLLELIVRDEMADTAIAVIQSFAHTGNPGDGKIFVSTVDDVVKIRTNERGVGGI